ncbi:SDR family oxidoreductase [Amycolatopsis rhabdoformis]|uniref:SDR family oxidoreductase n=1 Tax=Amycolatopsis rhabdoformis TaxID=1448059 RepID=A0ABZ1I346_9PSEU|nr:SDR family oxidoreductase [Amycolatopsis rhabdoformis]WSE28797.1 SDR family oxidoreductase [Amycolatopsis rhabdoformis]
MTSTETTTTPRVAIVTGGSGGIGRAVAKKLAADGMQVLVHYSGGKDRADAVVEEIVAAGGVASAAKADVTDEHEVAELFDEVEKRFGGVDVVVHTAGIMPLSPLVDLKLDEFDRIHRINVRGTFAVDREALRRMRAGGALVNISTSVTKLQQTGYSAYAASKGAVEAMTLILAREMRGRDITVNTVSPGPTDTPLFTDGKPQELIDRIAKQTPAERIGRPEDVAEVAAFLAGPGRWVNGQIIHTNGGAI